MFIDFILVLLLLILFIKFIVPKADTASPKRIFRILYLNKIKQRKQICIVRLSNEKVIN